MIKDITIGQYIPGESFIHKLDPRTKIIITLLFIIDLFVANSFSMYVVIAAFIMFVIYTSKLKPSFLIKGLKPIVILAGITGIINIFFVKGDNLIFEWGIFEVYSEGVKTAILMMVRIVFLVLGTSILTLTTSPIELTDGIEMLLNPRKKPNSSAHDIAMMMTIALRFIPTLIEETDKIRKAQIARGAQLEVGGIIKKAKAMIPMLIPLFISSFRRADELAMAMEARCYRGGIGRTRMRVLKLTTKDTVAYIVVAILIIITILSRFI